MSAREKKIGKNFSTMSLVAIAVIVFITALYATDLAFNLGWGYTSKDLKLGLFVLVFAVALRIVGLRMIAYFDRIN